MSKNVRKSKILLSLVAIALVGILFCNIYSLAADENTTGNPVTITATTSNSTATNNTNTNTNTSKISASVNNATNNTANNTANNTSTYNNTTNNTATNSTGLPYTGMNSKTVLLVVVFALSAVYAYKKVSDYNI